MVVFGILAVAAFVACFGLTRERVTQVSHAKGSLSLDVKTLLRNDQWLIVAVLFFVLLIGVVLRAGSAAYYIKWFAARPDLIAAFLTTATVAQMIGASTASWLTARLDKVPSYILAQVIIVLCSMGLYVVPGGNLAAVFVLWAVINFFVQVGAPILFTMAADTVEYGELKSGRRVTGLVFSGALLTLKLGVAVGGWLIGLILARSGYSGQAETQTPEAIKAILLSVTLLPAAAHLLLIPIVSFYKLNRKRCADIRHQLDAQATQPKA
jgi:GPH family glycoside/pentoside/hexuronide:cation symporter